MRLTRNLLTRIRLRAGIESAYQAAAKLGVTRTHLADVERGAKGASTKLIARMAELYGVRLEKITEAIRQSQRELMRRKLESD